MNDQHDKGHVLQPSARLFGRNLLIGSGNAARLTTEEIIIEDRSFIYRDFMVVGQ